MIDDKLYVVSASGKIEKGKPEDRAIREIIRVERTYHYTDKSSRNKKKDIREIIAKYTTEEVIESADK